MEGVLSDAKNQLTSEILKSVEMENQVQTLKQQLDLQRNISEQVQLCRQQCHWERNAYAVSGGVEKRPEIFVLRLGDPGDPKLPREPPGGGGLWTPARV